VNFMPPEGEMPPEEGMPEGMDPSQLFEDPSQLGAMQPDAPLQQAIAQQMQEPEPPFAREEEDIDLEGAISEAIETGCQMAVAASENSAEEFMRFSQGVNYLADALAKLQPSMDPAEASVIAAEIRAAQQANRPTPTQPSARG
jgi:hypothetical protein